MASLYHSMYDEFHQFLCHTHVDHFDRRKRRSKWQQNGVLLPKISS